MGTTRTATPPPPADFAGAPLVSALIAAYNEEEHIAECIESLLRQTQAGIEILVIDDGSTDRTRDIVGTYPSVRLLRQEHRGKAAAMNLGGKEAHGRILFFLDGDLRFEADYVAHMIAPILRGECRGTSHGTEYVANPGNRWAACWQKTAGLPPDIRVRVSEKEIAEGSVVFRALLRDDFLKVSGFDDVGFLDDQTLAPKLGDRARLIPEAACHHYNVETLHEVYLTGRWGAKSIAKRHGWKVLLRYFPLFAPLRGIAAGLRHRSASMLAYRTVEDLGIFQGACQLLLQRSGHFGK